MKKRVALLLAGLFSLWLLVKTPTIVMPSEIADVIDYEVKLLDVSRFDESGHLVSQIQTPHLRHNQTSQQHLLTTPQIKLLQPDNTQWTITSQVANSINDGKLISFDDHVVVLQQSGQTLTILTTDHLLYDPKNQIASTHTNVHIQQGNNKIEASGMKVTMKDKHIELLGKARGYYEPKKT